MPGSGRLALLAGPLLALACRGETAPPPDPSRNRIDLAPTVDEDHRPGVKTAPAQASRPSEPGSEKPSTRPDAPGAVRWTVALDAPVSAVRATPLGGLLLSAGRDIVNVTGRGEQRWRVSAGEGHQVLEVDGEVIVWSPEYSLLTHLMPKGRKGWSRPWTGTLATDGAGNVYLVDASTVAAMGSDGADRWRATPEALRHMEGPFPCDDGVLFQGTRGMESVAIRITRRGTVLTETPLDRGAIAIGAGAGCEPLVWRGEEMSLLDSRGLPVWTYRIGETPFTKRIRGGFLLVNAGADQQVRLHVLDDHGRVISARGISASGRVTRVEVADKGALAVAAVGLCLDNSSPCSRREETRGPFNTLVTYTAAGEPRVLLRHAEGHLGFVAAHRGGILVASSAGPELTEVSHRDASDRVLWETALPGRLTAGPYESPAGQIYVATCRGWECRPPFDLVSIVGDPIPEIEDAPAAKEIK
jgi:hypothetical protein